MVCASAFHGLIFPATTVMLDGTTIRAAILRARSKKTRAGVQVALGADQEHDPGAGCG